MVGAASQVIRSAAGSIDQLVEQRNVTMTDQQGHLPRTEDAFDLHRFLAAQNPIYEIVRSELAMGRKVSHWMWFVFPQLRGLAHSEMSRRYGISGIDEAKAYLRHPTLGKRLRECTQLVLNVQNRSLHDIFGHPDELKFHSCMSLFSLATDEDACFSEAIDAYCGGQLDVRTQQLLQ